MHKVFFIAIALLLVVTFLHVDFSQSFQPYCNLMSECKCASGLSIHDFAGGFALNTTVVYSSQEACETALKTR